MKNKINEGTITRNMLKTINSMKKTEVKQTLLTEDNSIQLQGAEAKAEQDRFRGIVTNMVTFTSFNVYPENKNVVFGGTIDDTGKIDWQFSMEEADGLYITVNNLKMTQETLLLLKRLRGYYEKWRSDWKTKLETEYNNVNGNNTNPNGNG